MSGSYEALESGNPADALVDFTGGTSETIDLVKGGYKDDLEKRKLLHQKLVKLLSRNAMASASIKVNILQKCLSWYRTSFLFYCFILD